MAAGPIGPTAYAANADLFGNAGYLRDPSSSANAAIATTLLNHTSRFVDEKCGRFFYDDGTYTRYWDGTNDREQTLPMDYYPDQSTGLVLKLAFYENQPIAQWLTVPGDGKTPGATNFFYWPTNPKPYIATGTVTTAPYQGFTMPFIPQSNTAYLPTPRPGMATISMNCGWGWQKVPDVIKDMTLKIATRAWLARQAEWAATGGSSIGNTNFNAYFDAKDMFLLQKSDLVRLAL